MKKMKGTPEKKKVLPVRDKGTSFPIVGIGASAGGLEACQELLRNLSDKSGMAFVFIMHLAPEHKSMLTELLSKSTKMPVREIKNGMPIEANHVYVIPPGANISVAKGKLKLKKVKDTSLKRMPIDWFFSSLAEEHGNSTIGVILSGTATDGTLGAEAIKAEGGIIFAQDEKTAKYNGMPQSVIGAGYVDFVLSPKKIAHELEDIAKHPLILSSGLVKTDKSSITEDKGFESIFDILRSSKGLDLTGYKTNTISRRISRRMVLLKLENLKSYIKFLRENKGEVENLYEDLLLKVTSFFRDPEVFHTLEKQIIPEILKSKTKGQDIRIWVAGCSSGEEAYSIAMCLMEALGRKRGVVPVHIFATDVSESCIDKARRGVYDKNRTDDIDPKRLKRFFTKTGSCYKVSKQLREMCVFSKQNVFGDPPFSNLDLISCRNLLIYLQPILQKKVFHNFHYGLRPGGFLLLGNSESAGGYSGLFKATNNKQRIFVKKYLPKQSKPELGQKHYLPRKLEIKGKTGISKSKEMDMENLVEQIVLSEYAPCGVLIDSNMDVVQFRGHTGRYLESAAGKPSLNIFKLVPKELFQPLHTAIYKARGTKHVVKTESQDVEHNGHKMKVNVTVIPVKSGPLKEEFFLVLFDEIPIGSGAGNLPKAGGKSAKHETHVKTLQKELLETKEYLRAVIEEQENVTEEVRTANEEILSSNEELLSTNEELETAKEELQSSNEELVTTNDELQSRNKEVVLLNNDLVNLLSSTNMPVIMMGTDLVIRRVTPQAEKVLNVISSDIGRPISKIKLNIDIPDFEKVLSDVIESLDPKTLEIKSGEGKWYSVYIRLYRTLDNKIDGVVVIFVDITESKKAQQIVEGARAYAESILETMREPLIVLDIDMKVIFANRSFYHTFKVTAKETKGQFIYDLGNRQWDIPKLRQLMEDVISKNGAFDNYEIEHDFESIGPKVMLFNARCLDSLRMILITIDDITERKQMEMELAQAKEHQYNMLIENLPEKVFLKDINSVYVSCNENYARDFKIKAKEIAGKTDHDFYPSQLAEKYEADDRRIIKTGKTESGNRKRILDGEDTVVHVIKMPVRNEDGNVTGVRGILWDITPQKLVQKKLLAYQKQLRDLASEISLAEEHERQRLAVELHDHITQTLVLFKINLGVLLEGKLSTEASEAMGKINRDIDLIIQSTRSLTSDLCSPTLHELGLEAAIREWLNEEVQRIHGIKTEFIDDGSPRQLDDDVCALLYRAVRELLINVIKHANATHVKVSIYGEKNAIRINVIDDGIGFISPIDNLTSGKTGGFGIFSIRERLNYIGGSLEVDSNQGHGTRVTLVVPAKLK